MYACHNVISSENCDYYFPIQKEVFLEDSVISVVMLIAEGQLTSLCFLLLSKKNLYLAKFS